MNGWACMNTLCSSGKMLSGKKKFHDFNPYYLFIVHTIF